MPYAMRASDRDKYESRIQYLEEQLSMREASLKRLRKKDMLFDAIIDSNKELFRPLKALPTQIPRSKKHAVDTEDLVLHLSDSHMDRVILPSTVQGLENYNFREAVIRAENLTNGVIKIKEEKLSNYDFPRLWILMYGDNTNGSIHDYESKSAFKNMFKNCFAISNVYALMLRDLATQFKEINCVCIVGNHGRTTKKKDHEDAHNSWDYAVYEQTRLLTQNLKNVKFVIPNSYSTIVNILGWNFLIEHGDDVKAWNGIPYYGIERKSRRMMALHASRNLFIHYFVYGHYHTATQLTNLGNSKTFINGAWYRTDPFLLSLGLQNEPSQWLHGVSAKRGITFRYEVWLCDQKKKQPERYGSVIDLYS